MKVTFKRKVILTILLALFAVTLYTQRVRSGTEAKQFVDTVVPTVGRLRMTVEGTGKIESEKAVYMVSQLDSQIVKWTVKVGDTVEAGQVIAQLRKDILEADYTSKCLELEKARQNRKLLNNELSGARKKIEAYTEKLKQSQSYYDKQKSLYETGAISAQDLESARQDYLSSQYALDGDTGVKGLELKIDMQDIEIEMLENAISELEKKMNGANVKADIGGQIVSIEKTAGEAVQLGDVLCRISDMTALYVKASVKASESEMIRQGQAVTVKPSSTSSQTYEGSVDRISPLIIEALNGNRTENLAEIYVGFSSLDDRLKLNQNVSVSIETEVKENALQVPRSCLYIDTDGKYYLVLKRNSDSQEGYLLKKQEVSLGIMDDVYVEITSGVEVDSNVVLNPAGVMDLVAGE